MKLFGEVLEGAPALEVLAWLLKVGKPHKLFVSLLQAGNRRGRWRQNGGV